MRLDLHRHLEGSHSPRALLEVARAFDIRTAPFFDEARQTFRSVDELAAEISFSTPSDDASRFYQCIVLARAAYAGAEAVGALSRLAFREAADETEGFEMRVSLFSMARTLIENQRLAWREVAPSRFAEDWARPALLAVLAARDAVVAETGKPILVRLGLSRTFESEPHYRALAGMAAEHAPALVGLDVLGIVAGADKEPMPAALLSIIDGLRAHLPDLTVHAGEFEGHASVDRTLELGPRAIGHGVRSLESPATLERLAREGVTLEVCPTSNRLLIPTALAALERAHGATPLAALQRANVHCVLGSDDPTPLQTSYGPERALAAASGVDLARLDADTRRRWRQLTGAEPRAGGVAKGPPG
jgi:adenosine deaminase